MLVTLDDTKNYLGISLVDTTYDVFLNSQIAFLSEVISNYCRRIFDQTDYVEEFYIDNYDPLEDKKLWTFHYPVNSITSINEVLTFDGVDELTLIPAEEYLVHNRSGMVERFSDYGIRQRWFQNMSIGNKARIRILYNAGYSTVPLDIQNVVFELIEERYNKKKSGISLNFGNDVQRLSVPGVMAIDFDYSLQNNERKSKYGMFIKGYTNILDVYRSERAIKGMIREEYVS